jgi:formamidopyrimidine-DNA glycosylase
MPELPEVETVRRGLAPVMEGMRITAVEQRRADLRAPFPERFVERLRGQRIDRLTRRAKYILVGLDGGETLVLHLGMSGSFRIDEETPGQFHHPRSNDPNHDHVVFHLSNAIRVTYNDPRRFGSMDVVRTAELGADPRLSQLGVEPLSADFNAGVLARICAGRSTALKAALLDQRLIAGLGNIYVCEALWRAKLSPWRGAGTIARKDGTPGLRARRLAEAIGAVLGEALEAGGSTLRDHRLANGTLGYFQHRFAVYDREGSPCPRAECSGVVARVVQNGRSTFFCPVCQR